MTVVLVALGGMLAAAGTRSCALAFVSAAVVATRTGSTTAPIATWTACLAAGWVLLGRGSPRTLAVPALGAAAVLAASASPNGAVVLGLWVLGTAAAVVSCGRQTAALRWALSLCAGDALVLLASVQTMGHLQSWPDGLGAAGGLALLLAAALRATLAAGPPGAELAGLLVVRTQAVVLVVLGAGVSGPAVLRAVVVVGAAAFAGATTARRPASMDVVQEVSLVAVVVASARLGWGPGGWIWGVLAASMLIHQLRFISATAAEADPFLKVAGLGLPFLPVALAEMQGAFTARGPIAAVVILGLAGGLVGRVRAAGPPAHVRSSGLGAARVAVVTAACLVCSVWAPVLSTPSPPAGRSIAWPPAWAAVAVVAAALAGSGLSDVVAVREQPPPADRWTRVLAPASRLDRYATRAAVWAAIGVLGAAALALWTYGLGRGFL